MVFGLSYLKLTLSKLHMHTFNPSSQEEVSIKASGSTHLPLSFHKIFLAKCHSKFLFLVKHVNVVFSHENFFRNYCTFLKIAFEYKMRPVFESVWFLLTGGGAQFDKDKWGMPTRFRMSSHSQRNIYLRSLSFILTSAIFLGN